MIEKIICPYPVVKILDNSYRGIHNYYLVINKQGAYRAKTYKIKISDKVHDILIKAKPRVVSGIERKFIAERDGVAVKGIQNEIIYLSKVPEIKLIKEVKVRSVRYYIEVVETTKPYSFNMYTDKCIIAINTEIYEELKEQAISKPLNRTMCVIKEGIYKGLCSYYEKSDLCLITYIFKNVYDANHFVKPDNYLKEVTYNTNYRESYMADSELRRDKIPSKYTGW